MEWRPALPKLLLGISVGYTALLTAVIGLQVFILPVFATIMEGERMAQGCSRTRTLLFGVDCHGFWGAGFVEAVLDIPIMLLLGPFAGTFELAGVTETGDLRGIVRGGGLLGVAALLWAPLIYLFIRIRRAT